MSKREERKMLGRAESAGEKYAGEQLGSEEFMNWVYDQLVEASRMDPSEVIPLETKNDALSVARRMLQQLEWDVKRGVRAGEIERMIGIDRASPDIIDAFWEGFSSQLEIAREWLADELLEKNRELRGGRVAQVSEARRPSRRRRMSRGESGPVDPDMLRRAVSMHTPAYTYINGRFQARGTMTPSHGPEEEAATMLRITRPGDVIEVKQGENVWSFKRTESGVSQTGHRFETPADLDEAIAAWNSGEAYRTGALQTLIEAGLVEWVHTRDRSGRVKGWNPTEEGVARGLRTGQLEESRRIGESVAENSAHRHGDDLAAGALSDKARLVRSGQKMGVTFEIFYDPEPPRHALGQKPGAHYAAVVHIPYKGKRARTDRVQTEFGYSEQDAARNAESYIQRTVGRRGSRVAEHSEPVSDPFYIVQGLYDDGYSAGDSFGFDDESTAIKEAGKMADSHWFEGDYVRVITRDGELVWDSREGHVSEARQRRRAPRRRRRLGRRG